MSDEMWNMASRDVEQDRLDSVLTSARIAAAQHWPFLAKATTHAEYEDRKALIADKIEATASRAVDGDPVLFGVIHSSLLAGFDEDFNVINRTRRAEAKRRIASLPKVSSGGEIRDFTDEQSGRTYKAQAVSLNGNGPIDTVTFFDADNRNAMLSQHSIADFLAGSVYGTYLSSVDHQITGNAYRELRTWLGNISRTAARKAPAIDRAAAFKARAAREANKTPNGTPVSDSDIRASVQSVLGGDAAHYDVEGIIRTVISEKDNQSLDMYIDSSGYWDNEEYWTSDHFWNIVERNSKTASLRTKAFGFTPEQLAKIDVLEKELQGAVMRSDIPHYIDGGPGTMFGTISDTPFYVMTNDDATGYDIIDYDSDVTTDHKKTVAEVMQYARDYFSGNRTSVLRAKAQARKTAYSLTPEDFGGVPEELFKVLKSKRVNTSQFDDLDMEYGWVHDNGAEMIKAIRRGEHRMGSRKTAQTVAESGMSAQEFDRLWYSSDAVSFVSDGLGAIAKFIPSHATLFILDPGDGYDAPAVHGNYATIHRGQDLESSKRLVRAVWGNSASNPVTSARKTASSGPVVDRVALNIDHYNAVVTGPDEVPTASGTQKGWVTKIEGQEAIVTRFYLLKGSYDRGLLDEFSLKFMKKRKDGSFYGNFDATIGHNALPDVFAKFTQSIDSNKTGGKVASFEDLPDAEYSAAWNAVREGTEGLSRYANGISGAPSDLLDRAAKVFQEYAAKGADSSFLSHAAMVTGSVVRELLDRKVTASRRASKWSCASCGSSKAQTRKGKTVTAAKAAKETIKCGSCGHKTAHQKTAGVRQGVPAVGDYIWVEKVRTLGDNNVRYRWQDVESIKKNPGRSGRQDEWTIGYGGGETWNFSDSEVRDMWVSDSPSAPAPVGATASRKTARQRLGDWESHNPDWSFTVSLDDLDMDEVETYLQEMIDYDDMDMDFTQEIPQVREYIEHRKRTSSRKVANPYMNKNNPYINNPPEQQGTPDDDFDGPEGNPLETIEAPTTARTQPSGAPADLATQPGRMAVGSVSGPARGGFAIVCHSDQTRFRVAKVFEDMTCPSCKKGAHLDLDDRTATADPSDPVAPLRGGIPDQDSAMDEVNPDLVQQEVPEQGAAPYTQDAFSTPINAKRIAFRRAMRTIKAQNPELKLKSVAKLARSVVETYPSVAKVASVDLSAIEAEGYAASERGDPAAPSASAVVRDALGDRPVGDPETAAIMNAFTKGYRRHNDEMADAILAGN